MIPPLSDLAFSITHFTALVKQKDSKKFCMRAKKGDIITVLKGLKIREVKEVFLRGMAVRVRREWRYYACTVLTVSVAAALALILHARTLPMAEGWYSYYAACIRRGLLPYRDFEYLYPPFYIYFVALFTRVFGYELIALRRLGILIFAMIAWVLYRVLTEAFGKERAGAAFFATVAAVFYMQSEVVQVFYDYVRVMDLVSLLAVLYLVRAVRAERQGAFCKKALLRCGLWLGALLQIKQNTGLIMLATCLALWVFWVLVQKRPGRWAQGGALCLLLPVLGVFAATLVGLAATGSLLPYFQMTWGRAAGAKGGVWALLFGWLRHNAAAIRQAVPVALLLLILLLLGGWMQLREGDENDGKGWQTVSNWALAGGVLLLLLLLLFCASPTVTVALLPQHYFSVYAVFLTVMPLFAVLGVLGVCDRVRGTRGLLRYWPYFILSGAFVGTAFACANSGGLADGQAYLGVAVLAMGLIEVARQVACRVARPAWVGGAVRVLPLALCLVLAWQYPARSSLPCRDGRRGAP